VKLEDISLHVSHLCIVSNKYVLWQICKITQGIVIKLGIGLGTLTHLLDQEKKAQKGSVARVSGCWVSFWVSHLCFDPCSYQFYIAATAGLGQCSHEHDMYPVIPSCNSCSVPSVGVVLLEVGVLR
jgi:hypothetical protein